jgi:hypothetical protein
MPVAAQSDIETYTTLDGNRSSQAAEFLTPAEDQVREWVGDDLYDNRSADDEDRIKAAEALLAADMALPTLNLLVQDGFGIIREKGFEQQREQLMGRRELNAYGNDLRALAKSFVSEVGDLKDAYDDTTWVQ